MKFVAEVEKAIKLSQKIASKLLQQEEHTRTVDSFGKNFKEKLTNSKSSSSKIMSWKYDVDSNAIMVKREFGRCKYYYHTKDIISLPKSDRQV